MRGTTLQRRLSACGVAAFLLAAQLGVQALTTAPASASTIPSGSVVVITKTEGPSVSSDKTATATCPQSNPKVLGGGFTTTGQHIVVVEARPDTTGSYLVTAVQDEVGTSGSWQLLAYAYCSSVAPGHQIIPRTSSIGSGQFNAAYPKCPDGKNATGGGGVILGGAGQVHLSTTGEGGVQSPTGYTAAGYEDITGYSGNWSVTGYVICVTYNVFGDFHMVKEQTLSDTRSTKSVPAQCPSGKVATGGAVWTDVVGTATSVRPNNATNPTQVTATARDDLTPGANAWTLYTTVFCAS